MFRMSIHYLESTGIELKLKSRKNGKVKMVMSKLTKDSSELKVVNKIN